MLAAALKVQEAAVQLAQARLSKLQLKAPFDGASAWARCEPG